MACCDNIALDHRRQEFLFAIVFCWRWLSLVDRVLRVCECVCEFFACFPCAIQLFGLWCARSRSQIIWTHTHTLTQAQASTAKVFACTPHSLACSQACQPRAKIHVGPFIVTVSIRVYIVVLNRLSLRAEVCLPCHSLTRTCWLPMGVQKHIVVSIKRLERECAWSNHARAHNNKSASPTRTSTTRIYPPPRHTHLLGALYSSVMMSASQYEPKIWNINSDELYTQKM